MQVAQSCPTLCDLMHYTVHGILRARILDWVPFPFSRGSPEMEPRFPALQADSLPAEPQGKPKNTGVGSLSLLQQIFLTQESNWGLLHCRWILYQLSYQGNLLIILNLSHSVPLCFAFLTLLGWWWVLGKPEWKWPQSQAGILPSPIHGKQGAARWEERRVLLSSIPEAWERTHMESRD